MSLFDTHIVVDWSARSTPSPARPAKDAIWWCVVRDGVADAPVYCRTRAAARVELTDLLLAEEAAGRRTLIGFDFPFGYPAGVAETLTGQPDALALWSWLAGHIEDAVDNANNRYLVAAEINRHYAGTGPCWGRPASWDHPDVPTTARARTEQVNDINPEHIPRRASAKPDLPHGRASVDRFGPLADDAFSNPTPEQRPAEAPPRSGLAPSRLPHPPERRLADKTAKGAKTVWQLAYAGSVGSQVLLGLPTLLHLRKATGARVWPFDTGLTTPDAQTVIAEVYPSLLQPQAHADRQPDEPLDAAQVRVNARTLAALDATDGLAALFSPALSDEDRQTVVTEEAWILGLGFEDNLRAAASRSHCLGSLESRGVSPASRPTPPPSHRRCASRATAGAIAPPQVPGVPA